MHGPRPPECTLPPMRGTVSLNEQQQATEASDSSSSSTSAFPASSSATELKESAAAPVSPAAHGGDALLSPVPSGSIMPTKGKFMGIPGRRPRVPLKNPIGLSKAVAPGLISPPIPRKVSHKDSPHTPKPPKCPPPGFSVGKGPIECADGIHSGPIDGSWWCKGWQAGYKKGSQDGWEEAFLKGAAKGYDRGYQVGYTRIYGKGPSWNYPAPSKHPKVIVKVPASSHHPKQMVAVVKAAASVRDLAAAAKKGADQATRAAAELRSIAKEAKAAAATEEKPLGSESGVSSE